MFHRPFAPWVQQLNDAIVQERVRAHVRLLRSVVVSVTLPLFVMACSAYLSVDACHYSPVRTAQGQALELEKSVRIFELHHSRLPQALDELVTPPRGRAIMERVPLDPWKSTYGYFVPGVNGGTFDVISAGPDKRFFSDDDVVSWR